MDVFTIAVFAVLLASLIGAMYWVKRMFSMENLVNLTSNLLLEVMEDKEIAEKVYLVGGLVGKGIMNQVGPLVGGGGGASRGGKFKMEDMIGEIIMQFVGARAQGPQQEPPLGAAGGASKESVIKRMRGRD